MDPEEEMRDRKRQRESIDMLRYVGDSEYRIPRRCPRGGGIIHEVMGKDEYDTHPGKRFFTCKNYEADGFHFRQPWVFGVEEKIERLTNRLEKVEFVINWVPEVNRKIERLERLEASIDKWISSPARFTTYLCRWGFWRRCALTEKIKGNTQST